MCLVLWDGKSAGVAVLFSLNFSGKVIRCLADSDSRVFSLLIDVNGFRLNLVNIYFSNVISDRKFFSSVCMIIFSPKAIW